MAGYYRQHRVSSPWPGFRGNRTYGISASGHGHPRPPLFTRRHTRRRRVARMWPCDRNDAATGRHRLHSAGGQRPERAAAVRARRRQGMPPGGRTLARGGQETCDEKQRTRRGVLGGGEHGRCVLQANTVGFKREVGPNWRCRCSARPSRGAFVAADVDFCAHVAPDNAAGSNSAAFAALCIGLVRDK